uniref:spore coat protein SP96-like n=1 Tax=Myxine glutinosa TaxID=7769 RepID=UPI00358E7736
MALCAAARGHKTSRGDHRQNATSTADRYWVSISIIVFTVLHSKEEHYSSSEGATSAGASSGGAVSSSSSGTSFRAEDVGVLSSFAILTRVARRSSDRPSSSSSPGPSSSSSSASLADFVISARSSSVNGSEWVSSSSSTSSGVISLKPSPPSNFASFTALSTAEWWTSSGEKPLYT